MYTLEQKMREYAELLIRVGLNVQSDQTVVIAAPVDCAPFARLCASAAYDAGCREVVMSWKDDYLSREKYLRAADGVFDTVEDWQERFFNGYAARGAAYLAIAASDPETLAGVDPDRLVRAQRASSAALEPFYSAQMKNGFPWCIASVPVESWAKKVFPDAPDAVDKLWDAIFAAVRVNGDGTAAKRWEEHLSALERRKNALNAYRFTKLRYRSALGTDLTVALPEEHRWAAGDSRTPANVRFVANLPTEEVFTAPRKDGVNGVVYASMPLVENGNVIEGIRLTLKDGRIVEAHADRGQEFLEAALAADDGARYLGEAALVPYDSPISRSGILFYNTLFDENASCHFAFGDAYAECIRGGEDMTREELDAAGLNHSFTHVDFMVGTADLSIVGTTKEGREVEIFRDGNFVIA